MPSFGDTSDRVKPEAARSAPATALSAAQRHRYARHIVLPEVGEEGQAALLRSRVLLVGAGGLGSPVALYLGAAGVGTLGIVDMDVVEESNLQRQVLHNGERLGRPKVESAAAALGALNPEVEVVPHRLELTAENAREIISGYDLVVDGVDNYATRYLVNDVAMSLGKAVVHGSVYRFEGQVTVFRPGVGPCYRCLYPQPPPEGLAPNNAAAGLLGALPGIIGSLEAMEAVKLCLDRGESLAGRLLVYDALRARFRELKVKRDPECPACPRIDEPTRSC